MKNNNGGHTSAGGHHNHNNTQPTSEVAALMESFYELEKCARTANGLLREYLEGTEESGLVKKIDQLDLPDLSLRLSYATFAISKNEPEIARAIKAIKKSRGVAGEQDPADHINYTAL